jgi:hypothetical protein
VELSKSEWREGEGGIIEAKMRVKCRKVYNPFERGGLGGM